MKIIAIGFACVTLPIFVLAVQEKDPSAQLMESKANQIATAAVSLRFHDVTSKQVYESTKDQRTLQIQRSIDNLVNQGFDSTKSDTAPIQKALQAVLRHPVEEYIGPPFTTIDELRFGRSLLIGYMLIRGGSAINDSAVTFRAYQPLDGTFNLVDTTGQDLDGYNPFFKKLTPPVPGETWLFVWGVLSGNNAAETRMRLYAFDGQKFRMLWSPPDVFKMSVEFTKDGFDVTRIDEDRYQKKIVPYFMRDVYVLLQDGPHLNSSSYVAEP